MKIHVSKTDLFVVFENMRDEEPLVVGELAVQPRNKYAKVLHLHMMVVSLL